MLQISVIFLSYNFFFNKKLSLYWQSPFFMFFVIKWQEIIKRDVIVEKQYYNCRMNNTWRNNPLLWQINQSKAVTL